MKRRVLCVFLIILYLLVVCTMLSAKIEEEMSTLVKVEKRTSSRQTGRSMTINIRAVYTDSEGDHLYEVREGEGWDNGLRTYDVPGFGINMVDGVATLYGPRDYVFVRAASRQPRDGELATIVEEFETGKDMYLYYYKHGVPTEWDLPPYLTVIAQSKNALLMENSEGAFPFLPHLAKTWTVTTDMADRVFSLTEADAFLTELPAVTKVFAILGCGIILLLFSWCLSVSMVENKWLIRINVILIIVSLAFFLFALSLIDLPASMLPSVNIFDFEYYREEFFLLSDLITQLEANYAFPSFCINDYCALAISEALGVFYILISILTIETVISILFWRKNLVNKDPSRLFIQ